MARSDYAHWNEEQDSMWWAEEGRFGSEEPPYCDLCGVTHAGDCEDDDYDDYEDDEDAATVRGMMNRHRINAFGQRLRDDAPELPGDHYAEDAHLEAAYEDRYEVYGGEL